ncbi:MAG: hypothetical protein GY853_07200 [PVC group bacterium]|nr:hypothetical protein [PVC group bacterium]
MGEKITTIPYKHLQWFNIFNILLVVFAILFAGGLLWLQFFSEPNIVFNFRHQNSMSESVTGMKFLKKPMDYYERILSRKRLFVAQPGVKRIKKTGLSMSLDVLLDELQLQGIVSGPQGPQAIIFNAKTNRSHYCQGGETIGGFIVKEVLPDKVVLDRDNEEVELKL